MAVDIGMSEILQAGARQQVTRRVSEVLHEAATDESGSVSERGQLSAFSMQQQPRDFQSAGGKNESPGADTVLGAFQGAYRGRAYGARIMLEIHDGGVQKHGHILARSQFVGERRAKAQRRAESECRIPEARALVGGERFAGLGVLRDLVVVAVYLQDAVGTGVKLVQVLAAQRLSAKRHPRPVLEIQRVHRTTPAAPVVARAAEKAL